MKTRTQYIALAATLMILTGVSLSGCAAPRVIVVTATPAPVTDMPPTAEPSPMPVPTRTPKPTSEPKLPEFSDFDVELIIIEKQCFGSAGCLITFEPDLYYDGSAEVRGQYILVYEVHGGEDGTLIFNIVISGDEYVISEEHISTAHEADELSTTVVRLLER